MDIFKRFETGNYAWVILNDVVCDGADTGTVGPADANDEMLSKLADGGGTAFRMKDDDGEIYYYGKFVGDVNSDDAFGPLEDFGMPNAGCTNIEYKNGNKWEIL